MNTRNPPDHTLWPDEDRKVAVRVFLSEHVLAARNLCPPADYTLPPKDAPLGPVFYQTAAYMDGVLESFLWAESGYPEHPMPYRVRAEAHEDVAFLKVVRMLESMPESSLGEGRVEPLDFYDPEWTRPRKWTLHDLRLLWGHAREYKPPRKRPSSPRELVVHRMAGRFAIARALHRNFGFRQGQADVVTAFVEVACKEYMQIACASPSPPASFLTTLQHLLAGTGGVRNISREASVNGVVQQAIEKARALHDEAVREASLCSPDEREERMNRLLDAAIPGACEELTHGVPAALETEASGESLSGHTIGKDRSEFDALLPEMRSLPAASAEYANHDRFYR